MVDIEYRNLLRIYKYIISSFLKFVPEILNLITKYLTSDKKGYVTGGVRLSAK